MDLHQNMENYKNINSQRHKFNKTIKLKLKHGLEVKDTKIKKTWP